MAKRDNLSINMEQFPENYDHLMNCVTAPSVTLQERGFHAEGQIVAVVQCQAESEQPSHVSTAAKTVSAAVVY
ncbi:hypothetical protein DPMN_020198 [Dreissena polymorpha]|uniref:Uncharacterized protein n=1 Tax=Dreissena polymorpha TaxID=45954 RepID=A0A9D4SAU4_DREPO|nr:hypothetical protein DPMN_020198 [Dreissena polymorpha]